jgi:alcohol dehydrogenase class IV
MGIPHPEAEFRDLAMRFMGTRFIAAIAGLKEQAFDDQCTGANPRYPLIGKIKQMYLSLFQNPVGFGTD